MKAAAKQGKQIVNAVFENLGQVQLHKSPIILF